MTELERIVVRQGNTWAAVWVRVDNPLHAGAVPLAIKAEARRRILAVLPEWKQVNATARMTELLMLGPDQWTPAEQAEADALQALWGWVKTVRARSDQLEAAAVGKTLAEIEALDLFADASWPAGPAAEVAP